MMNFLRKRQPGDLSEWLEMATDKLVVSARERIGLEIETHYDEAVASRLEAGDSESEARARALTELGDPRAAARHFRQRHLTASEAKQVKVMFWGTRRTIFLVVLCYLMFATSQCISVLDGGLSSFRFPWLLACATLVSFVLLPTAGFILARRKRAESNLLLLYWMQPSDAIFMFFFVKGICQRQTYRGYFVFFVSCVAVYYVLRFRLWNKLRRMQALGEELPPGVA